MKPKIAIVKPEAQIKNEVMKAKLKELGDKKKQGKLILEDIDAKLDIVIEMLQETAK